MKQILETLGLKPDATEEQAVASIKSLQATAASRESTDALEKKIRQKIAESGGALNRQQAILALNNQAAEDARRKKK